MNISEIFGKGRNINIKKQKNNCTEVHPWVITEKSDILILKRASNEKILYNLEKEDLIKMEITASTGIFIFESKVLEIVSENEIQARLPVKIVEMKKRAFKRVNTKIVSEIKENSENHKSLILDISEGGVYITMNSDIKPGAIIKVISVIENKKMSIEGKIKRKEKFMQGNIVKKYGYGIEFLDLTVEEGNLIRDYIYLLSKKA